MPDPLSFRQALMKRKVARAHHDRNIKIARDRKEITSRMAGVNVPRKAAHLKSPAVRKVGRVSVPRLTISRIPKRGR